MSATPAEPAQRDEPGPVEPARAEPGHVAAALHRAAAFGPYFVLGTDPDDRYVPLDAASAAGRVAATRAALERRSGGAVAPRVAASLTHLDLAARLVSPALVTAAADRIVPDVSALVWRPERPGVCPMALPAPRGWSGVDLRPVLAAVEALGELVAPQLNRAIRRGNVASAVATAARLAPVCTDLATAVLAAMPDAGSAAPQGFRRRSCCLYYRVHERAGICGDCVLAR